MVDLGAGIPEQVLDQQQVRDYRFFSHRQAVVPMHSGLAPDGKPDQQQRKHEGQKIRRQNPPRPLLEELNRSPANKAVSPDNRQR